MSLKLAVNALCCKEANPVTADAAIKFMMETLGNENSETARELQMALKLRFFQRGVQFIQGFSGETWGKETTWETQK